MKQTGVRLVLIVFALLGTEISSSSAQDASSESTMHDRFSRFLDELWEFEVSHSPLFATSVGDHRFNERLDSVTLESANKANAFYQRSLLRLDDITKARLDDEDQLNASILRRILLQRIDDHHFKSHLIPITNREGFHISFPQLSEQMPMHSETDYRDYVARLNDFQRYVNEHIATMRAGADDGYTLPAVVLEGYRAPLDANIVDDPTDSLLYKPFTTFPKAFSIALQQELQAAGIAAIQTSVVPGYRAFRTFMQDDYVPAARDTIAAAGLPDGRAFYRHCVKKYTTLDILPEQVHAIGQREVARIRGEMQEIIERVGFEGDFAAFIEDLRSNPKFYATTPEQLLKETAFVLKRLDGELPKLFKTLPRTPYGIRVIPEYIAPQTTTAYYQPPRGDGSDAGYYFVNTYNLKSRPLYGVEALSCHEAVPGHHLQIALQQELENLPNFRRYTDFTAFVEGWALYSERLGLEVGLYQDPYSDFGRLTYEMWRACRLVVDTGMHYLGWSRSQAIEYMESNSALSKHNIRAEVDRYISWPGQALGYKIGELKIRELRKLAESELGERFDLREFHDVVLLAGAVPLDVLENRVLAYIAQSR